MKRSFLLIAVLFLTQFSFAKNVTVVIRGSQPVHTGSTVVAREADTLSVTPSVHATTICVRLKDAHGAIAQQYVVSATSDDLLNIVVPALPQGSLLEVRDDREYVYLEFSE